MIRRMYSEQLDPITSTSVWKFWNMVVKRDDHWFWPNKHAYTSFAGRKKRARNLAYNLRYGMDRRAIYNLCGDPDCIRPDHNTHKKPVR